MKANPTACNETKGCKQLAPSLARPISECVHAGADSEAPLAPLGGVQATSSPIGCTPSLAPPADGNGIDPTASPDVTRILLGPSASKALTDAGAECFRILTQARHPDMPGRWVIILAPCTRQAARAAESVILGTHRAARIRPPATATTGATTNPAEP
jgi:hypothetical protein